MSVLLIPASSTLYFNSRHLIHVLTSPRAIRQRLVNVIVTVDFIVAAHTALRVDVSHERSVVLHGHKLLDFLRTERVPQLQVNESERREVALGCGSGCNQREEGSADNA